MPVFQFPLLLHARLAREIKLNHVTLNAYVFGTQRRYTVATVFRGVHLATWPHEASGQQANNRREHAFPAQIGLFSGVAAHAETAAPVVARNVVLVHGAWADGSSWAEVIPYLQAAGLKVTAVQNPLTSLADSVAATRRALALQDGPTVLVAHSWGGTVISETGTDPKVSALVYVAARGPTPARILSRSPGNSRPGRCAPASRSMTASPNCPRIPS